MTVTLNFLIMETWKWVVEKGKNCCIKYTLENSEYIAQLLHKLT